MSENTLRSRIQDDMKTAMRTKETARLGTIRLLLAAIKQKEIDERITLDDAQLFAVIDKMVKQRNDSIEQYRLGNRQDLVDKEAAEISVIKEYLPSPLTEVEIDDLIKEAIQTAGATSVKDMAKVMAFIKPKAQGRADIGKISAMVKDSLSG
jgi:uncharacterized protein